MQAELNGEVRPITRNRRGVVWCPFCDTSSVLSSELLGCTSCLATFSDEASDIEQPRPRRRRAVRIPEEAPEDDTSVPEMTITAMPEESTEE
jgi:protein-arginine kinase activator protein McsA